ncbi:MAG: GNAT family N-acetyltransferase [Actinobacteria bacterium]|nr:GNAT family N-acetyltransferase [Actinomycetota bacterium]
MRLEIRRYDDPVAQRLVAEVQAEYVQRYGGPDRTPVDPAEFAPPKGLFLVGVLAGLPVVCGGWRVHEQAVGGAPTVEIKRMYVAAVARRRGLARRVLAELEHTAARAGNRYAVLNTGDRQPEAIALYESAGYHAVSGFGTYRDSPSTRFYGKPLPPAIDIPARRLSVEGTSQRQPPG